MENREAIVAEYFKLKLMFNRGNKTANEKTEPQFAIVSVSNFELIFAFGLFNELPHRSIGLCKRDIRKFWHKAGFLELRNLEEYCAYVLNEQQKKLGFNESKILSKSQQNTLCDDLTKKLRSLGI